MLKWLDKIEYPLFILMALLFLLVPFVPKPHSLEKIEMLFDGTLKRPLDIFDLIMHLAPTLLLLIKFIRDRVLKSR